jgi:predicted DNA-binding protein with PD1-like motif
LNLTRRIQPLKHPGAAAAERRTSVVTRSIASRVTLPAGAKLLDAMADALEALGATSGQVELLDGSLSRVSYCFPALCEDGSTAVTYSSAHEAIVPARLIAGSATVGYRDGKRLAHCHATWFDANGDVRGGHLWWETLIGPGPVQAIVHALDEAELICDTDPECRLPVFTPHPCPSRKLDRTTSVRAVMSRLAPGVEVAAAVREIMREQGFQQASIAGSVGSLVGAVFHRRDNTVAVVDGPATEVTFTGEFDLRDPSAPGSWFSGMAIDRFGAVHAGELVEEETIVACAMELLVEEVIR